MNKFERWLNKRAAIKLATKIVQDNLITKAAENSKEGIPVLIVSFNNAVYVSNMVNQLNERNILPIVIDNASSDLSTIDTLSTFKKSQAIVLFSDKNLSHLVGFLDPIYKLLPETFAYTDPDLQLNSNLPENFLTQMAEICKKYEVYKSGMALEINIDAKIRDIRSNTSRKYPFEFNKTHTVMDWESQYWKMPLKHENLEIYAANVDTTFAVYQKSFFNGEFAKAVRIAGNYSAIHLPWFDSLDITSIQDRAIYANTAKHSTWIKS